MLTRDLRAWPPEPTVLISHVVSEHDVQTNHKMATTNETTIFGAEELEYGEFDRSKMKKAAPLKLI